VNLAPDRTPFRSCRGSKDRSGYDFANGLVKSRSHDQPSSQGTAYHIVKQGVCCASQQKRATDVCSGSKPVILKESKTFPLFLESRHSATMSANLV
jgi:hypothetical protein